MRNLLPVLRQLLIAVLRVANFFFLWSITFLISLAYAFWKFRNHLFSFKGRIGRKFYWATLPIFFMYSVVVAAGIDAAAPHIGASIFFYWGLVTALVIVPLIVSAAAVGVKRLHDSNKSGWWLLVFYGVPAALVGIPGFGKASDDVVGLCVMASCPFLIWAMIILGCKRGTIGPNLYGAGTLTTGKLGANASLNGGKR
jgi:uncharacterized membrane protein YhaH (DUF805 family)